MLLGFRLARHLNWHRWMYTLPCHSNTWQRSVFCIIRTLRYVLYAVWLLINNNNNNNNNNKQDQYLKAHKLRFLINSLFTITIFILPFQICMILIDSLPLTVQCHAICPVSTVCNSKWRWRFTQRCKVFWNFGEWNFYFCRDSLSEYRPHYIRPYIFPGKRKLSFSRRPHDVYPRRYISPVFSIRVRNSAKIDRFCSF